MKMASAFSLLLLVLPIISCSACLEQERMSLMDFKKGLNFTDYEFAGAPLESWRGLNCCAWEGVGCHPRIAHVISLDLYGYLLAWNEIRVGLFQLLHLEYLDLTLNSFKSPLSIPPQLGELRRLKYLRLAECGFIGQIPTELTKLQQLKYLDLSRNNLWVSDKEGLQSIKFSDSISNLKGLEELHLSYNNLTMAGHNLLHRALPLSPISLEFACPIVEYWEKFHPPLRIYHGFNGWTFQVTH